MPKGKRTINKATYYQAEVIRQEAGAVIVEAFSLAEARELALEVAEGSSLGKEAKVIATIVKINKIKS